MEATLIDDKFLASQAIYRISGHPKCSLCGKCKYIERHILKRCHIHMLSKFHAHFTSRGTQPICKLCNKCVDWKEVTSHLKVHSVMPWYRPDYVHNRLFAEGTWKIKKDFYCWICAEFSGMYWYEALEHCDLKSHIERLEGRIVWPSNKPKIKQKQYKDWIKAGFTPDQDYRLLCQLCRVSVELKDATVHFRSSEHATNKRSVAQNMLTGEKAGRVGREVSETLSCKGSTISCEDSGSSDNITLSRGIATPPSEVATPFCKDSTLFCNNSTPLCDDSALRNTAMPSYQVAVLCDDSTPFCEDLALRNDATPFCEVPTILCDDAAPTCEVSASCCQNEESLDSLGIETTTPSCTLLDCEATRPRHDNHDSPNDFDALSFLIDPRKMKVEKNLKGFKFYCVICVDPLRDIVSARNHVSGQLHAVSMKKYGCESIVQTADGYYCKCCDREMNLISLVYSHVLEKEHRFRFQSSFADSKISDSPINGSETLVSSITGRSEEEVSSSSSPSRDDRYAANSTKSTEISEQSDATFRKELTFVVGSHITKLGKIWRQKLGNQHSLYCVICDERIRDVRDGRDHVSSPRHVYSLKMYRCEEIIEIENGYYCKCCDHIMYKLKIAYRHVLNKMHSHHLKERIAETDGPTLSSNASKVSVERPMTEGDFKTPSREHSQDMNSKNSPSCEISVPKAPGSVSITGDSKNLSTLSLSELSAETPEITRDREARLLSVLPFVLSRDIPNLTLTWIQTLAAMRERGINLYCLICEEEISDMQSARNHVSRQEHIDSMIKFNCESIVSSGVGYYCQTCALIMNSLTCVYLHVLKSSHVRKHPNSLLNSTLNVKSLEDFRFLTEFTFVIGRHVKYMCKAWKKILSKKCINGDVLYCVICDETLLDIKNARDHVSTQWHADSMKKYGCEEVIKTEKGYYCNCCDHAIGTFAAAYRHVKSQRHSHHLQERIPELGEKAVNAAPSCEIIIKAPPSCEEIEDATLSCKNIVKAPPSCERIVKAPPSCETIVKATPSREKIVEATSSCEIVSSSTGKSPEVSVPHIIRLGKNKNTCRICTRKRCHTFDDVQGHVRGRRHQLALEKLGCAMAPTHEDGGCVNSETKNEVTRPTSCNLEVGSLENGYPPINGFDHTRSIKVKRDIEKTESWPRSGNPATPWNSLYDYIAVKMDGSAADTLIEDDYEADTSEQPKAIRDIMKKRMWRDVTRIKTPCNICGTIVTDFTSLHCHLALHLSDYFVSATKNNSLEVELCNFELEEDCESNDAETNDSQCPPMELLTLNEGKTTSSAYKINLCKTLALLNFNNDTIYEMVDKIAEYELCSKLCTIVDPLTAYCLVCRETVANTFQSFYDHLSSLGHCTYLDMMENDAARFSGYPDQFSDLDLGLEYMEETSDDWVLCYACAIPVTNDTTALREHVCREDHTLSRTELHTCAMRTADLLKSRIFCNWYCVDHYWCVPCRKTFDNEVKFVAHLKSGPHSKTTKKFGGKTLLLDYCASCALLWYGFRVTRSYHELTADHVVLARAGYNVNRPMSKFVMRLLTKPEAYADSRIRHLDDIAAIENTKQRILLEQLEKIVRCKFPRAKAYAFGSRIAGLGTENSDLDIFLDCGNAYDGNLAVSVTTYFLEGVYECLCKHPNEWDVDELLQNCKAPIIRVHHRETDLKCDLSFQNGLGVENTLMIRKYCDVYPPCRKLIITLKQWLTYCNLADARAIKSYALSWLVIFYLQSMWILPSINTLVKMKNKSRIIDGWEVGASHDFTYYEADLGVDDSANLFVQLLKGFFGFYAEFDFRRDVVCPLLGQPVYKIDFIKKEDLPKEMEPYLQYLRESSKKNMFAMDSPMCVQDPFRMNDNLTKAVGKRHLNVFRIRCGESLNFLQQREAYK